MSLAYTFSLTHTHAQDSFTFVCSDFFKKRDGASSKTVAIATENSPPEQPKEAEPAIAVKSDSSASTQPVAATILLFGDLCRVFEQIEGTTKRLAINDFLTDFFVQLMQHHVEELLPVVYLCLCRLGPAYEGLELGLGEALLVKAISNATGRPTASIKSDLEEQGDIGLVAQASRSNQSTMFKPKRLTCLAVFKTLKEIATATGQSAVTRKIEKIRSLLVACEGFESKYLFRMLAGKLRIGLAEKSVLIALAHASNRCVDEKQRTVVSSKTGTPDEKQRTVVSSKTETPPADEEETDEPASIIKTVFNSLPNYDIVIPRLLEHGIYELPKHCTMEPGIPLKPMLAHPTKSLSQVLDRFENLAFTCEYKYDGERAQIHRLASGECLIYSRNSENMSQKYPDIREKLPLIAKPSVQSFVLDCEVVAWEPQTERILPFQILSTRKRKDVTVDSVQVQVVLMAFDLLYLNGEPLLKRSLRERRVALHEHFIEVPGEFYFAKSIDSSTVEDIQTFLDEAVQSSCEGLMIKTLDAEASYEPSKRSRNWLKVKKDYLADIGDSLDLVVMGGYAGRGKRTGVYGGFLLGCHDPDSEEFQAICKIGTGFSEQDLETLAATLRPHVLSVPKPYYRFGENVRPDVWFDSVCVWEVKAADFSISPIYTAAWGLIEPGKGISLRFPRFIRDRTGEKGPEDATTSQQVAEMYEMQAAASAGGNTLEEDDYY